MDDRIAKARGYNLGISSVGVGRFPVLPLKGKRFLEEDIVKRGFDGEFDCIEHCRHPGC